MDELVVKDLIDRLIDLSFAEDIGDGDHTTLSCIPADAMGKSKLLIKEEGILAGIEVAKEVFRRFDPTMKVEVFIQDGTHVKPGDVAMVVWISWYLPVVSARIRQVPAGVHVKAWNSWA